MRDRWSMGWGLESPGGELVGLVLSIPALYSFQGEQLVSASSCGWVVAPGYRGYGLQLLDEYLNQPGVDLCMMTSTGAMAAPVVERIARRVPVGRWDTASRLWAHPASLAKRRLHKMRVPLGHLLAYPAGWMLSVKNQIQGKRLPSSDRSVTTELVSAFDLRFDTFWDEMVRERPKKLLADRHNAALTWHFRIPLRQQRLWVATASRNRRLLAYCTFVCKGQDERRYLRLCDYQSLETDRDLLPTLLRLALRRCVREKIGHIEHTGTDVPAMEAFDRNATSTDQLPSWVYYYHATDAQLDEQLRAKEPWDPSVYDGDASVGL